MGDAGEEIAEEAKQQSRQHGWSAQGHGDAQESRIHGSDMGRVAGEEIMAVEVNQAQHQESEDPAVAAHHAADRLAEPGNDAQLVQEAGHHHQSREPHQRVPGAGFCFHVFPAEHAQYDQSAQADKRGSGGVHVAELLGEDPQHQEQSEDAEHHVLFDGDAAQFRQFLPCHLHGVRRLLDLGRIELVDDPRHDQQAEQAGDDRGQSPAGPGDVDLEIAGQLLRKWIGGHRRKKHGAGDAVDLIGGEREKAADLALRAVACFAAIGLRQADHDGHDDAAGARGIAGNGGREHQVGGCQPIAEAQRALAEQDHEVIGDARAQAGLDEAARDEEGQHDQPDHHIREAAQRVRDGQSATHRREGDTHNGHCAHGQRLENDADNGSDEDGQKMQAPQPVGAALGFQSGLGCNLGSGGGCRGGRRLLRGCGWRGSFRLGRYCRGFRRRDCADGTGASSGRPK